MSLAPRQPVVTLTFDLQNLIRSSVGANEYSLQVLLRLLKLFVIYRGQNICAEERMNGGQTNERGGRTAQ